MLYPILQNLQNYYSLAQKHVVCVYFTKTACFNLHRCRIWMSNSKSSTQYSKWQLYKKWSDGQGNHCWSRFKSFQELVSNTWFLINYFYLLALSLSQNLKKKRYVNLLHIHFTVLALYSKLYNFFIVTGLQITIKKKKTSKMRYIMGRVFWLFLVCSFECFKMNMYRGFS